MKKGVSPNSPNKHKLAQEAAALKPFERKERKKIGQGAQSIILAEDHRTVLIVTRYTVAKRIELVRKKLALTTPSRNLITLPMLAGMNVNLAYLIDPYHPKSAKKAIKYDFHMLPSEMWETNVVYKMSRFQGSLEDCKTILRYKEDSIEALEKYLYNAVELLHEQGLTHNDICLKNIFYSGTYPHLQFHLGDFGSVTENPAHSHIKQCAKDCNKIKHVITQAKEFLKKKRKFIAEKTSDYNYLPYFARKRAEKLGLSPTKELDSPPLIQDVSHFPATKSATQRKLDFKLS